jgi:Holliday junction resolvase-like predicted endonuclease
MPNKNYRKGRAAEYLLKHQLEREGFLVIRASGSHGEFDLIAAHRETGFIRFIQVKSTNREQRTSALQGKFAARLPLPHTDHYTQEIWIRHVQQWYKLAL